MIFKVRKSSINGIVAVPGSKSHTIRSLFFAGFAEGRSLIKSPLLSDDTRSAMNACTSFGGKIEEKGSSFVVDGFGPLPKTPDDIINVGNSGTTLGIALSTAALAEGYTLFTGDDQIRSRPLAPLIDSLNSLGAFAASAKNNGRAPVIVKGRVKGGSAKIDAVSSQFLTSLLMNCPMAENDTSIEVTRLNERPYIDITLWWLDKLGIKYENKDYRSFFIPGRQTYGPFEESIPADFSSATFFAVLASITGGKIKLKNLDMTDPQGDKAVMPIIESMGAKVTYEKESITIEGKDLKGIDIDMNAMPDALPALAVAGCFARGETRLLNVPQARMKETDRIRVMCEELKKLGADISELDDGLVIKESRLKGASVNGRRDHRIVMALAVAGLAIGGETVIETAESAAVTYPEFREHIQKCGGRIQCK